jgi:hypothetical protein
MRFEQMKLSHLISVLLVVYYMIVKYWIMF